MVTVMILGYVAIVSHVCFVAIFPSAELKNLRLWVDAASQNAWDTGKNKMIT